MRAKVVVISLLAAGAPPGPTRHDRHDRGQTHDALEADDVEGVDLDLAAQAKEAFEAGNDAQALDLLTQATGMTPAEALALQSDEGTRPSEVPIADQLGSPG